MEGWSEGRRDRERERARERVCVCVCYEDKKRAQLNKTARVCACSARQHIYTLR